MKKIMEEFDKEDFLIIRDFFRGPIIDDSYNEIPRISIALRFKSLKDKICPKKQDRYLAFANQSTRIKN